MRRIFTLGLAMALCYIYGTARAQDGGPGGLPPDMTPPAAVDPATAAVQKAAAEKARAKEQELEAARQKIVQAKFKKLQAEQARSEAVAKTKESQALFAMIVNATKAMDSTVWQVHAQMYEQLRGTWQDWGKRSTYGQVDGLISGKDFYLMLHNVPAPSPEEGGMRINGKFKCSTDGGKMWHDYDEKNTVVDWFPVDYYEQFFVPLPDKWNPSPPGFEIVGKELHQDGTWLHIHALGPVSINASAAEYWLLLDEKGKPVNVRRVESYVLYPPSLDPVSVKSYIEEDFAPAGVDEKIEEPAPAK